MLIWLFLEPSVRTCLICCVMKRFVSPAQTHGPESMVWEAGLLGRLLGPQDGTLATEFVSLGKRPQRARLSLPPREDTVWEYIYEPDSGRSRDNESADSGVSSAIYKPLSRWCFCHSSWNGVRQWHNRVCRNLRGKAHVESAGLWTRPCCTFSYRAIVTGKEWPKTQHVLKSEQRQSVTQLTVSHCQ